jgi:hypothetical protein
MDAKKPKMLAPKQYAERQGVAYTTVMNWLRQGKILGAVKHMTPTGHYWEIPVKATKPELLPGRPPHTPPVANKRATGQIRAGNKASTGKKRGKK